MKNFILLISIFLLANCQNSNPSLKGVTIGKKYDEKLEFQSTVGGIEGLIQAYTLNNDIVYRVHFIFEKKISHSEASEFSSVLDIFMEDVQKNYDIILNKDTIHYMYYTDPSTNERLAMHSSSANVIVNNIDYDIQYRYNWHFETSILIFTITDQVLYKQSEKQSIEQRETDF